MKKNIVILGNSNLKIVNNKLHSIGGAESQIHRLALELGKLGHSVFLIYPGKENIEILDKYSTIYSIPLNWANPRGSYRLYRKIQILSADILITRAASPLLVIYALISRIIGSKLIYFSAHDWELRKGGRLEGWRWILFYIGLQFTSSVLCQNDIQLKGFKKLIIRKNPNIYIVANLLLLKIIDEPEDPGEYFTWIGTCSPKSIHKNPEWILKIAKIIPNKKFHLVIHFWNNEILENEFRYKIKDFKNIKLSVSVDRKSMLDIHKESCALLITSDGEGFPNVALEAWSQGRCVITRDTNALCDLTFAEGTYIAKGIDDFATIIKSTTVNEFKNAGENGLSYLTNNYLLSNPIESLEKIIYKI